MSCAVCGSDTEGELQMFPHCAAQPSEPCEPHPAAPIKSRLRLQDVPGRLLIPSSSWSFSTSSHKCLPDLSLWLHTHSWSNHSPPHLCCDIAIYRISISVSYLRLQALQLQHISSCFTVRHDAQHPVISLISCIKWKKQRAQCGGSRATKLIISIIVRKFKHSLKGDLADQ